MLALDTVTLVFLVTLASGAYNKSGSRYNLSWPGAHLLACRGQEVVKKCVTSKRTNVAVRLKAH